MSKRRLSRCDGIPFIQILAAVPDVGRRRSRRTANSIAELVLHAAEVTQKLDSELLRFTKVFMPWLIFAKCKGAEDPAGIASFVLYGIGH